MILSVFCYKNYYIDMLLVAVDKYSIYDFSNVVTELY